MWQAYPKKMYPKQCVVCWIPALLTLRLFPECAAGGEDCQAQTFFSFKYIIILWVSTCPCKVIDRADFLPSYENPAYEYVSTRTLKIIFYKKLNFLQILFDLISSGLRYWLNLEGKISRFIILDNQQHKAFWPNQIHFFYIPVKEADSEIGQVFCMMKWMLLPIQEIESQPLLNSPAYLLRIFQTK